MAQLEQVQADDLGDRYLWRKGLEALPSWKSKSARHAAKRKAAKSGLVRELKETKIDVLPQVEAVPEQRSVRLVDYSDDEDTSRRVVFISQSERSKLLAEVSGSTPATPEPDSAMGVGRPTILSKEIEDESEKVYKQLKELVDEPVAVEDKGERSKPKPKVGMRSGMKKGSKSRTRDSRVYSYDELIEYRPKRTDSNDDNFWFRLDDKEMEL